MPTPLSEQLSEAIATAVVRVRTIFAPEQERPNFYFEVL
jgi:hypothetical protein